MRTVVVLAVVAACGRVGFGLVTAEDAARDSTPPCFSGHDEDGDGIDDCADVCPHVFDPAQLDGDGDGVGDACDPNPTEPRDHIALFDPMTSQLPQWSFIGTYMYTGDAIAVDSRANPFRMSMPFAPTQEVFEVAGHVTSLGPGNHQISVQLDVLPGGYYCELYQPTTNDALQLSYTPDGVTYNQTFSVPMPTLAAGTAYVERMFQTATQAGCAGSVAGTPGNGSNAIPSGIVPNLMRVQAGDVVITIDYFIWIHSD